MGFRSKREMSIHPAFTNRQLTGKLIRDAGSEYLDMTFQLKDK